MYISCEINDTGATVSILSERVWNSLKHSYKTNLEFYTYTLSTANGENVEVKGKVTMKVTVCGFEFDLIFIVANIDLDGLLCLYFLTEHNCEINVGKKQLIVQGRSCTLTSNGRIGCYRVTVQERIVIPPRSEMIIEDFVKVEERDSKRVALVEPHGQLYNSSRGLVARTVVRVGTNVPVRLMNIDNEPLLIQP